MGQKLGNFLQIVNTHPGLRICIDLMRVRIRIQHFSNCGSGSRIRIQQLKFMQINADPDPDTNPDPQPCTHRTSTSLLSLRQYIDAPEVIIRAKEARLASEQAEL